MRHSRLEKKALLEAIAKEVESKAGDDSYKNLVHNAKALRTLHGISQEEFAKHFGTTQATVSRLEHGLQHPTVQEIHVIAKCYKISVDELFAKRIDETTGVTGALASEFDESSAPNKKVP